ncbi:hypothetical protein MBANPS3_005226 [Mucor bainieri]
MKYTAVNDDDFISVGVQCQLCCKPQKKLVYTDDYGPDLGRFYRSDTEPVEDFLEKLSNNYVPARTRREGYSNVDYEEEVVDNMLENWWNGSFSIPAPSSYTDAEETCIGREQQISEQEQEQIREQIIRGGEQSSARTVYAEEVDYEDLFKRLMNVNIYAVAEYMSNGDSFCFNEHIINTLILFTIIGALYLIF